MTTDAMHAPLAAGQIGSPLPKSRHEKRLDELAAVANRHHEEHVLVFRTAITHARDAGRALRKAKKLVNHKGWGEWLEDNFNGSPETARAYMRVAKGWKRLPKLDREELTIADALKALARPRGTKTPPGATGAGSSHMPMTPPTTDTGVESLTPHAPSEVEPLTEPTPLLGDGGDEVGPTTPPPPQPDTEVKVVPFTLSVIEGVQVNHWLSCLKQKLRTPNRNKTLVEAVKLAYLQHFPMEPAEAQR